jgi:hypothetical protein
LCTVPGHGDGEHNQSCVPPADPAYLALRLLRAIYGLCPDCDNEDHHDHEPPLEPYLVTETTDPDGNVTLGLPRWWGQIHKAAPGARKGYCGVCGQGMKRVPGGSGPVYVHSDSGAVAAPNPPGGQS